MGNSLCQNANTTPTAQPVRTIVGKQRQVPSHIPNIPKYYQLSEFIAEGGYGQVRRCGQYAVKIINLSFISDQELNTVANQLKILRTINHDNIVKYYEDFIDGKEGDFKICMVMEWCETSLRKYLSKCPNKRVSQQEALKVFKQILSGYQYLKNNGIVHRDLKPENILLKDPQNKKVIKIADFGLSKIVKNFDQAVLKTRVGSNVYMSPEVLQSQEYTTKSQIWSLGIILYELIYGERPYKGQGEYQVLNNIKTKSVEFSKPNVNISNQVQGLITKMLQKTPKDRIQWSLLFENVDNILKSTR